MTFVVFLNAQIAWILEALVKVQVFLYFWYESFLAVKVCTQGTWICWMNSVVCFDRSLLFGETLYARVRKPFRCRDRLSEFFKRIFLWRKIVSKSQYVYDKDHFTVVCWVPWPLKRREAGSIVNWVEWLWNPSDSFVICFCGPESAQRSKEFLSFWLYWPIKTLH